MLGLRPQDGERLLVVEHVLLRPGSADDLGDALPLLEHSERDPYSLRLSVLLPERLQDGARPDRALVERVVRAEVPAHLRLQVRWLDDAAFAAAEHAWTRLLAERRRGLRAGLGLDPA